MNEDDFETMARLVKVANDKFDGHLMVLKFTTNWRIGFVAPDGRDDISAMCLGETFDEAATAALSSVENA